MVNKNRGEWVLGKSVWEAIEKWLENRVSLSLQINGTKLVVNMDIYKQRLREQAIRDIHRVENSHGLLEASGNEIKNYYKKELEG
jgi:hypothetical protein